MHIIYFFSSFYCVCSYKFYSTSNYENNYIFYDDVSVHGQKAISSHRSLTKVEECLSKCQDIHHDCNAVSWIKEKQTGSHECHLSAMNGVSWLQAKTSTEYKYTIYTRRVGILSYAKILESWKKFGNYNDILTTSKSSPLTFSPQGYLNFPSNLTA